MPEIVDPKPAWFKVLLPTKELRTADCPAFVPWPLVQAHAMQCMHNHSQTVQRLHERGGLAPDELVAVLNDRKWVLMSDTKAIAELKELVDKWQAEKWSELTGQDVKMYRELYMGQFTAEEPAS